MERFSFTPCGIVSLLTDFGLNDPFVGQMHGVILSHARSLRVVDMGHGVPAHDVAIGGFWLERSFAYFPPGTVHVAVVDPGVGTEREAIVTLRGEHVFVAPDNGLLSHVLDQPSQSWRIDAKKLTLNVPSRTFHGRDLFAPVAARLAAGSVSPWEVGTKIQPIRRPVYTAKRAGDDLIGHVLFVDRFGNLVTDVGAELVGNASSVYIGDREVPIRHTYADVADGELVGLISSFRTLEIAERGGRASEALGCGPRSRIVVSAARRS